MTKKVTAEVLSEANVDSNIDLRITKNDIIELMLEEEADRLNAACAAIEQEEKVWHDAAFQQLFADFKKRCPKTFKELEPIFGVAHVNHSYGQRAFIVFGDGQSRVEIPIEMTADMKAKNKAFQERYTAAHRERSRFLGESKRARTALIRKLLEQSEEGMSVLKKVTEVRKTLLLSSASK